MRWHLSHRFDARALPLADAHYNRQKPGTPQFVPPGRNLVLLTEDASALWVTSWPLAEYTHHEWAGAWINSLFRNERRERGLSPELIREAVAATLAHYGDPPALGMVTFVKASALRSQRNPGCIYRLAGFRHVGETKERGHMAFQLLPVDMPAASPARPRWSAQLSLFAEVA